MSDKNLETLQYITLPRASGRPEKVSVILEKRMKLFLQTRRQKNKKRGQK